jgi:hypothetical protein
LISHHLAPYSTERVVIPYATPVPTSALGFLRVIFEAFSMVIIKCRILQPVRPTSPTFLRGLVRELLKNPSWKVYTLATERMLTRHATLFEIP